MTNSAVAGGAARESGTILPRLAGVCWPEVSMWAGELRLVGLFSSELWMDPIIQQIGVNAVAAAAVIVVLVIVYKDRRADAKDRKEGHEARAKEQAQRDKLFTDALAKRDAAFIAAQEARDNAYAASIERLTRASAATAADCHAVHRESIEAANRAADTNERVVKVLEKIEKHVAT